MKYLFKMIFISALLCVVGSQNAIAAGVYTSIYQGVYVSYKDSFNPDDLMKYNNINPALGGFYTTSCYNGFKIYFPPGVESVAIQLVFGEKDCFSGHTIECSPADLSYGSAVYSGYDSTTSYKEFENFIVYATNPESNQGAWVNVDFPTCPADCSSSVRVSHSYQNMDLDKYKAWYDCVTENNMWQANGDPPSGHVPDCDVTVQPQSPFITQIRATPSSGVLPLETTLSCTVTSGTPDYNYSWDFGDGSPASYEQSPQHTYNNANTYTATVTVTDAEAQTASASVQVYVMSDAIEPLVISASAEPSSGVVPLITAFSCTVTSGTPDYNYSWDFGDGSPASYEQSPQHTYNNANTYTATVTVTDAEAQTASASVQVYVMSDAIEPLVVSASAEPSSGVVPLITAFSCTVTSGTPDYNYSWDFGDGSPASYEQSPQHTYNNANTYTAIVSVSDAENQFETAEVTVTVSENTQVCTQEELDMQYAAGRQACIDDPESCGINVSVGFTQEDLDAQYLAGKQDCIEGCRESPDSCGINVFSRSYSDGYTDGYTEGINSALEEYSNSGESQSLVSIPMQTNLGFKIPMIFFSHEVFNYKLKASFEYVMEPENLTENDLIWKLNDLEIVDSEPSE